MISRRLTVRLFPTLTFFHQTSQDGSTMFSSRRTGTGQRWVGQCRRLVAVYGQDRYCVAATPQPHGLALPHMVTTYAIGKRANAYFGLGPDAIDDPEARLLALPGVDERKLAARVLSNQEIADKLSVSQGTASTHVRNILAKLHLANRTQAVLYALREGLASLHTNWSYLKNRKNPQK